MSKADKLGVGSSFGKAPRISARRAAIAAVTDAPTEGVVKQEFRLEDISFNPDNPRGQLNDILQMADTLESVGQVAAITLATVGAYLKDRPHRAHELKPGAQYVVVDGHRRLAGAQMLEWETIRAVVDDAQVSTDERLLEAAFVANTQRDDMTEMEQAEALRRLVTFHGSQSKTARRLGLSQAVISQRLSLLSLTPELQADLGSGARRVEHVRGLAKLSPQQQKAKADERAARARARAKSERAAAPALPAVPAQSGGGPEAGGVAGAADVAAEAGAVRERGAGQGPSWPEPEWAVGDVSEPVAAARSLVERFSHEERRTIVSYLLSVGDSEEVRGRERAGRAK